jgi:hypothetical protein
MLYLMVPESRMITARQPRLPNGDSFELFEHQKEDLPFPEQLFTSVPYLECPGRLKSRADLSDFLHCSVFGLAFSPQVAETFSRFTLLPDQGIVPLTIKFDTTTPISDCEYRFLYQRQLTADLIRADKSTIEYYKTAPVIFEVHKWHIDLQKWGNADVRRGEGYAWIISERLKDAIEEEGFTGFMFEPVEAS